MASHHHRDASYYEPRPQSSARRHDSFNNPERSSTKSTPIGNSHSETRGRSSRYGRDEPLSIPLEAGRPHRSHSRQRKRWPPQPCCEDERTSLLREADNRQRLRDLGQDEVQSRGTVDQETVIEDVPELLNRDERRFVVVTESSRMPSATKSTTGMPTPPTSEDEKARRARRRPSRILTDSNNAVPEMSKRTATPYTFKPQRTSRDVLTGDGFLSPDTLRSAPLGMHGSQGGPLHGSRSQPSSPTGDRKASSPLRTSGDYFSVTSRSNDNAIDDTDGKEPASRRAKYPQSSYPPPSMAKEKSAGAPRTSVVDFAPPASHSANSSIRESHLAARRNTETGDHLPVVAKLREENARRQSPLASSSFGMAAASASVLSQSATSRLTTEPSPSAARHPHRTIPLQNSDQYVPPSPPRSPRASTDSRDGSQGSRPTSSHGSRTGSRPSTPSLMTPSDPPRLPKNETDWSTVLAANNARLTKTQSRPMTTMRQVSMPAMPDLPDETTIPLTPSLPHGASFQNPLPYPLDDGPPSIPDPLDQDYHKSSEDSSALQPPVETLPKKLSRSVSPARSSSYTSASSSFSPRPQLTSHHSYVELPQISQQRSSTAPVARGSIDVPKRVNNQLSSHARSDLYALSKKPLPDCRRAVPIGGKDDWYTISSIPNLKFCPDCAETVFARTFYWPLFRRSTPSTNSGEVQCALGASSWIRFAWRVTLLQQRSDLTLLKDMIDIDHGSDPCPGHLESLRSWYSVRDLDGLFVEDFHICWNDVRKVEQLLPQLRGLFVRLPSRTPAKSHICSLRAGGNRFRLYAEELVNTHSRAVSRSNSLALPTNNASTSTPPPPGASIDPMPLINLIEKLSDRPECPRDSLCAAGKKWHYHPSVPHLTVCEDCYALVVAPAAENPSSASTTPRSSSTSFSSSTPTATALGGSKSLAQDFVRGKAPAVPIDDADPDADPSDDAIAPGGQRSCQLYSPRMRRVFARAVRDNDLAFLARKAVERREAERRLVDKLRRLERRALRCSREVSSSGETSSSSSTFTSWNMSGEAGMEDDDVKRKFDRERLKIRGEWVTYWE